MHLADPTAPEARLGAAAVVFLLLVAVPVVAVAALLNGRPGALGALGGVGLVGLLFGLTGVFQAHSARRGPQAMAALTWMGVGVRMVVYGAALAALGRLEGLHRPTLAVATAVAFVATLAYEVWLISRTPQLYWVRADRQRPLAEASAPLAGRAWRVLDVEMEGPGGRDDHRRR